MADPVPPPMGGPGSGTPRPSSAPASQPPARRVRAGQRPPAVLAWVSGRRRTIALVAAGALAAILLLVLGLTVYAYATLPDPSRLDLTAGAVAIVDRHGALIEERNAQGARVTPVTLKEISVYLQKATIAAEDRHFYEHGGIDWPRVAKALIVDVIARRPAQGASTIEEQLAKVAILNSPKRSGLTKLRELLLATALDQRYSKDQILTLYLNTIYYGHGATGIESASEVYFSTHAKDLTLPEASLLAGLPRGPSLYDPKVNPDLAKARQRYVLDGMVAIHAITQAQADAAFAAPLHYTFSEQRTTQAPHFVDYVMQQLENEYGANAVAHGGFVVKTTLDLTLQHAAEHAVATGMHTLGPLGADNGDLLAMDPRSGEILAMVGSADFYNDAIKGQFNVVTSPRQPGSSFKPYVYEEAFRSHKLTMGSMLDDTASHFANGQFHDFDFRDMGLITAHASLLLSRNVSTLEVMQKAGISNVIDLAKAFGIGSPLKPEIGTAIGSSAVTMLDQVEGYGVFANGGTRHAPTAILEVRDQSGNLLDKPVPDAGQQVVNQQEAYLITYILKDYSRQWHLGWNRPMAGKSGTTNDYKDAWMMAYAPNLVVGAWVGHTGPGSQNMNGVFGTMVGSSVLRDFINNGLSQANIPVENFQRPAGLEEGAACPADNGSAGKPTSAVSVFSGPELYLPGTKGVCPTPSATPSASPSPSPSETPSALPSILPSILPTTSPTPAPSSSPSPGASPRSSP
ncbi:MAG TPA: transglycosylase domain-containing protein [Candidatus Limnocylindrales bacterium]|nr:transglycosylase domain-containing protein [Candidatus Limnocylindrales bacterium]